MKKRLLAILLALVLCFSAFALIACNHCDHDFVNGECTKCGEKDPNYKPGGNADVPVADGKVTLYFTMADDSVALPEYASVFYAGGLTGWAEHGEEVPEFKNVEGTKLYYIQIAYDATKEQATEYSLTLGYNSKSGLPADKCGIDWNKKSDLCATFEYGTNATFTYTEGATKIDLGTHKFSAAIGAPETADKVELRVTFSEALPKTAEVYFMGGFAGWDAAKGKAAANEDRTVYTLTLEDILCTDYDYKILVVKDKSLAVTTEGEGDDAKALDIWDWNIAEPEFPEGVGDEESVMRAYIEIGAEDGGNIKMSIMKSDDGSYIDMAGTISETNADREEVKTGLNLAQVELVEGKEGETPNNIFTYKYQAKLPQKTLVVNFTTALPETAEMYIFGTVNGWNASFEAGKAKMTIAEDRKSASITLSVLPGEYEANIIAVHADYKVASAQEVYDNGVKINQNGNHKFTVDGGMKDSTVQLFEEAQIAPELTVIQSVEVTFKVTFSEALTGWEVYIAGTLNTWEPAKMTANTANTEFTITLKVTAKEHEFAVLVCKPDATDLWANKLVGNAPAYGGQDNAKVTVPATDGAMVVLFSGLTLVAPTVKPAA